MSKPVHFIALFRLSVLGSLTSRIDLEHGEVKRIIKQLAKQTYQIPNSRRVHISEKTIERWFYRWRKNGIDGLAPKSRKDKGSCILSRDVQEKILALKKEKPSRSIPSMLHARRADWMTRPGRISPWRLKPLWSTH